MINWIALLVAILLSCVSGYFSVIGLATIFSASFWPVVVMGTSLELGKVVSTSWLYRNWTTSPSTIKYYLTVTTIVLSLITSLGVFGYLSRAHIEMSTNNASTTIELKVLNQQIDIENKRLENLLLQSSKYETPSRRIENEIAKTQNKLVELNDKKLPILKEENKLSAEVGPLKYIAELLYGQSDESTLNSATRFVIILIVVVFDPFALCLLIAANSSIRTKRELQQSIDSDIIEVDRNSIVRFQ